MLLRFGVENMFSFDTYQEISLVVPKLSDQKIVRGLLQNDKINLPVLPALGIYGANASGKSNLLICFKKMCNAIVKSHNRPKMPSGTRRPFLLNDSSRTSPSHMECDVIIDGLRYQYGFRINDQIILEEWLYSFPSGNRHRVLFHRNANEQENFYFGPSLKGSNRAIQEQTRNDSLFLSTAGVNNHKMLSPLWQFFADKFIFSNNENKFLLNNFKLLESSPAICNDIIDFLREADTGISNIEFNEISEEKSKEFLSALHTKFPDNPEMCETIKNRFPEKKLSLQHKVGTKSYSLPFNMESQGTHTMLNLSIEIRTILNTGGTLIVDEIESNLHPYATKRLIDVFQNEATNPHQAQILFTTHNTYLLADTLTPAQVWLCEKNVQGATELYPLTSVQPRKGENLENGYLKGRYGGIPYMGPIENLWRQPNAVNNGQ